MFYRQIKPYVEKSPFFQSFYQKLSKENTLVLGNLNRSLKAVTVAYTYLQTNAPLVFVSYDEKSAEDYYDDLCVLLGTEKTRFLPDYELLPYEERSPHYSIRAQRIETLAHALFEQRQVFCLSLRSFLRKITTAASFKKNIKTLKRGHDYQFDALLASLVSMGYENQPQVSKVGEFSHRGGIIDIYSPQLQHPLRLDFFGDTLESLRPFNLISQRSLGDELDKAVILPVREFSLANIDPPLPIYEKIRREGFYEGIENDLPLILKERGCFMDFLPAEETIIFFDEYAKLHGEEEEMVRETNELWQKAKASYRSVPDPVTLFSRLADFKAEDFGNFVDLLAGNAPASAHCLEAPFFSQTVLHGELNLLEQIIAERIAQDYKIIIQFDNKSQAKRMRDILPEYAEKIDFSIGVLQKGFNLPDVKLAVFTDHEIFSRFRRSKAASKFSKEEALVDYETLNPGDYVVHIEHGIGVYEGLTVIKVNGAEMECLKLKYAENDRIYVPTHQLRLVSRYVSEENFVPSLHKIGAKKWEQAKGGARKQIELIAEDLVKLYAERKLRQGVSFLPDTPWQKEMEEAFIYEDTQDQARATQEIKADMEAVTPMERLLCGDVGFGKTEVAIRAAFKAVLSGYQVAVLVPTTLLAEQHFYVFRERLAQYPVKIAMFSRFRSPANIKKDMLLLQSGEIDIAIGTHRLLSKDAQFKKIGLLIIDEEHRFGVRHKDKLRQLKSNVDTLYMSATPIPRTLSMSLARLKEMSLIQTSPKARLPIRTVIIPWDDEVIKDAVLREVERGGQVFFVHNRVQTINALENDLKTLLPQIRFRVGHGQMAEKELEQVMFDFSNHKFDVLIATTIIESGIDIPNANTIIVHRADMFGLAQLYQMRGRVGRSNRRAYAYLIVPSKMEELARKRLETLTEYNSLGAGFQIAMRDLELRGAGSLLGTKQSGAINAIGFNYYQRLLEQAVKNLETEKPIWLEEEIPELKKFVVEDDFYFPPAYIQGEGIRLDIYKRMLDFTTIKEFDDITEELKDRFGTLPELALQTITYYKMRMLGLKAGLSSFSLRNKAAILEFAAKTVISKQKITELIQAFDYPVHFDTSANLKIRFELPFMEKKKELDAALKILSFIENWN